LPSVTTDWRLGATLPSTEAHATSKIEDTEMRTCNPNIASPNETDHFIKFRYRQMLAQYGVLVAPELPPLRLQSRRLRRVPINATR